MDDLAHWAIEALSLTLLLSAPALAAAFAVAFVVGLLQAATQVQDPTLSFVPRFLAVVAVLLGTGAWMGERMVEFTSALWTHLG